MVRIADVFTAMTELRPWRPPHTPEAALAQMELESGTSYDAELMDTFVKVFQHAPAVALAVE